MDRDYFLEDYRDSEQRHRLAALEEFRSYEKNKKGINLYAIQTILNNAIQSSIYQYMTLIRRIKLSQKEKKFMLFDKRNGQVKQYNQKIDELKRALSLSVIDNPFLNNELRYGYCPFFNLEDHAVYALFHDILPYYQENLQSLDQDRRGLYDCLYKFKGVFSKERNEVINKESIYVDRCLQTMQDELDRRFFHLGDLPSMNILIAEVKRSKGNISSEVLDYNTKLYTDHTPMYTNTSEDKFDGFENETRAKSAGLVDYDLKYIGPERSERITEGLDMRSIKQTLELKKQAEEVLEILENIEYVLRTRDNTMVDPHCFNSISYTESLNEVGKAISYCRGLVNRYAEMLNQMHYPELHNNIVNEKNIVSTSHVIRDEKAALEEGKITQKEYNETKSELEADIKDAGGNELDVIKAEEDGHRKVEYEKIDTREKIPSPTSLSEINARKIMDRNISRDLLVLSAEDLFKFGFVPTPNYDELEDKDIAMVIEHCSDLRDLANMSDEDRTRLRATWPRMENGKVVTRKSVTEGDVLVQRNLDDMYAFNNRLNTILEIGRRM